MPNYYQFLVPRLNGLEIERRFSHYHSLVRKGVAGFILFGGELETVQHHISRLQDAAKEPLIIASDLERGLGQQVEGGTLFPPAMGIAAAYGRVRREEGGEAAERILKRAFRAMAREARETGINTIFAPVLDVNTNPDNPIISVRAFGEKTRLVGRLGCMMVETFRQEGIVSCGKHFPGHGNTSVDSHIRLPVIRRGIDSLKQCELVPFQKAIAADVPMIMLGHLSVPALDRSGTPVSFSPAAVRYLREEMGFSGILTTDAMNMAGIGRVSEEEACRRALEAGVDILLHPSDADTVHAYLRLKNAPADAERLRAFRQGLPISSPAAKPSFSRNRRLSGLLAEKALQVSGGMRRSGRPLFVVVLNDDPEEKGQVFIDCLQKGGRVVQAVFCRDAASAQSLRVPGDVSLVVAVFSEIRAWKGGAQQWLPRLLRRLAKSADAVVSFNSPYLLRLAPQQRRCLRIAAYSDLPEAQAAAAREVGGKG